MSNTSQAVDTKSGMDFKVVLGKILGFLPFFLISISICMLLAFLVNRYSNPRYLVKGSLLIKERGGMRGGLEGQDNFLQGMQLLSTNRNIENEQGLIKSRNLVEETLKGLDFGVSYFSKGAIRNDDLYGKSPFIIEIDSSHLQVARSEFSIQFLKDGSFSFKLEKPGKVFLPKGSVNIEDFEGNITGNGKPGEWVVNEIFKWRLTVLDLSATKNTGVEFLFTLNQPLDLVKKYFNTYQLKPINKQSSIVEVTRESNTPNRDIAFVDHLMKTYINLGLQEKSKITQNTLRFIDNQLALIGDSLGMVEEELLNFKRSNKVVDISESGQLLVENIGVIEKAIAEEEFKLKYIAYLNSYIKGANPLDEIIAPSTMGLTEPVLNLTLQKMVELYTKKKSLEGSFTKTNPLIIETDRNLESLKEALLENIKSAKESSNLVIKDLKNRIQKFETKVVSLPQSEQKFLNLTRRYQLSDKLFTYLLEKRAEAGIAGSGINPDAKIVDNAVIIEKTYPKAFNNYLLAMVLGLVIPLVILIIMDFFNNSIDNHTQLQQATRIPLVGNIMHNNRPTALVIANHPKSQVSEAFRNLRSNISYLRADGNQKVIMVTSTVSGEGKTFISMNISSVLAIGGYKTLLIGVDLRKPKIFQDFKLDNSIGLTNYLIGKADKKTIIQPTGIENLDIITAGPTPPNPSELIMSQRFYNLIEELKETYDYIVLDTPPIGLVADGLDIMKHSDLILYVVRQTVTKKTYLNLINEIYAAENVKNIGLVFNDVNFAAIYGYGAYGYGYGYGYGTGYSYGYGYSGYGYGYGYGNQYGYGDVEKEHKPLIKRIFGL